MKQLLLRILRRVLGRRRHRQSFKDFLSQMPNVGEDEDFEIASGRGRAG
jgi:hypothetical protein